MENPFEIKGSGKDYYKNMTPDLYREYIHTPSRNPEYFALFHKPLIDRAKARFGSPIRLLDIACGPADELDFIKDDKDVRIIATDISMEILPHVKEKLGDQAFVFANDTAHNAIAENVADAGIMVNAMIYVPDKMLLTMFKALKPGAECVMNIRVQANNESFRAAVAQVNGIVTEKKLKVQTPEGLKVFDIAVYDTSQITKDDGSPNLALRQMGQQIYFEKVEDVRELISLVGFIEKDHSQFKYEFPQKSFVNTVEVFVLQKPE